jgi:hypothetical protein
MDLSPLFGWREITSMSHSSATGTAPHLPMPRTSYNQARLHLSLDWAKLTSLDSIAMSR